MPPRANVAIRLEPKPPLPNEKRGSRAAVFYIRLSGLVPGERVELTFHEMPGFKESQNAPRVLGSVAGKATAIAGERGQFSLKLDEPPPTVSHSGEPAQAAPRTIEFLLPADGVYPTTTIGFDLANENADKDEGDAWEIAVSADNLGVTSPTALVARVRRALAVGTEATYQQTEGNDVKFYNDGCVDETGSAGGAFADLLDAISKAKKFIFVADWSFHPLFRPSRAGDNAKASAENSIGKILIKRAEAGTLVAVHTWDHTGQKVPVAGVIAAYDPLNDSGMQQLRELAGGTLPTNLLWRASSSNTAWMSHHQKFVVLDSPTTEGRFKIRVFFGGLDLSKGRFDHPGHPVWPPPGNGQGSSDTWAYAQSCGVKGYSTDDWYNAEFKDARDAPRQPWHDIHAQLSGPSAWDFVREFVGRWICDPSIVPGSKGHCGESSTIAIKKLFYSLYEGSGSGSFVKPWEPHKGPFTAQVVRSIHKPHWNDHGLANDLKYTKMGGKTSGRPGELSWRLAAWNSRQGRHTDVDFDMSTQHAYLRAIDQAEKFIYIETQYFIGSGSRWGESGIDNEIPEQIVKRIKQRRADGAPFHVYIVTPMFPEGDPSSGVVKEQRWLSWRGIEWMIKQLGDSWNDYLSFYFLANWETVPKAQWSKRGDRKSRVKASKRYMVYVHSKLMLVDDRVAILGSANLNERSLAGNRDTEIGCTFWPTLGREEDAMKVLREFRRRLWVEHLGALPSRWEEAGSSGCVRAIKAATERNYVALRSLSRSGVESQMCKLCLSLNKKGVLTINKSTRGNDGFPDLLPDSPKVDVDEATKAGWAWSSPGSWLFRRSGFAE